MDIQNVFRVQLYFEYPSREIARAKNELSSTLNTIVSYTHSSPDKVNRERRYDHNPQQRAALTRALEAAHSWPGIIVRIRQTETIARFSEYPKTEGTHHFVEVIVGVVEPASGSDILDPLLAVIAAVLDNPYVRRPTSWALMISDDGWQKLVRSSAEAGFDPEKSRKTLLPLIQQLAFPDAPGK